MRQLARWMPTTWTMQAFNDLIGNRYDFRDTWRMPRLAELAAPVQSRFRVLCLYTLRGYLIVSVILITFKIALTLWG